MKIQFYKSPKRIGESMKKLNKKLLVSLVIMILMIFSLYAKDSFGIGLQFGALGSKPTYPNLSTTSCDVPYSFNPNVHVDLQIPVCDIDAISFFSINVGYDYSMFKSHVKLEYGYGLDDDISYVTHFISLIPTFTFTKSNFRLFLGTGFSVTIKNPPYEPSIEIGTTYDSDYFENMGLSWTINAGLKYKLGKHLFLVTDMSFFVSITEEYNRIDGNKESCSLKGCYKDGGATMKILPKIGLMISF